MSPKFTGGRPPPDLDAVRVCVCGTRTFDRPALLFRHLDAATVRFELVEVVVGGEGWFSRDKRRKVGADFYAVKWGEREWWDRKIFLPDWTEGKSAGPKRNAIMVTYLRPGTDDCCVAFRVKGGESNGTDDMVARAVRRLGPSKVKIVHYSHKDQ